MQHLPSLARAAVCAVALSGACRDASPTESGRPAPSPRATVSVRLDSHGATIELEDSTRLRATVFDDAGQPVAGARVTWETSDALPIDSTGLLRSFDTPGTFTVRARYGVGVDSATIVVRPRITLQVWPDTNVLLPGMSRALATQRWAADSGGLATLTGANWSSSDGGIASVDGSGRVTALHVGHATITATRGDRRASAEVYVLGYHTPLRFAEIRPGAGYTCARTFDGDAYCWGASVALGTVGPTDRCESIGYSDGHEQSLERSANRCAAIPVPVDGALHFAALAEGTPCGMTADGTTYCWGARPDAAPGVPASPLPQSVTGLPAMRQISGSCGVSVDGNMFCGNLLLNGSVTELPLPASGRWAHVSVGPLHACALTTEGIAYCWGLGQGALGAGPAGPPCAIVDQRCADPIPVATTDRFVAIGAGWAHTCALRADGRVECWGYGAGQPWPASGPIPSVLTPTEAPVPEALAALTVRGYQDCGLGASGATYCWGLDIPSTTPRLGGGQDVFARALPPFALRQVDAGGDHLCGIATDGIAWCWGGPSSAAWGSGDMSGGPSGAEALARVAGQ